MFLKSTKLFDRMPCAHAQWFSRDNTETEYSGACAKWHGYSRSFKFEFSGIPDENGWVVPFGGLKQVRKFLEYYFDHTAVAPADDPRMDKILEAENNNLFVLRVLPYGVSMEMSSLFAWRYVNAYIMHMTGQRCFVSRLEVIEHEPNSGIIEANYREALNDALLIIDETHQDEASQSSDLLVMKPVWEYQNPHDILVNWER